MIQDHTIDRRQCSTIRRQLNDCGWSDIGKGLCVWLIYENAMTITTHWDALFVLLLFIIAPKWIDKFITMRWGNGLGYTKRTSTTTSSATETSAPPKRKPDPDEER